MALNYNHGDLSGRLSGTRRTAPDDRNRRHPDPGLSGVTLLLKPTVHAEQMLGGRLGLISGALAAMTSFSVREPGARGEPETRTVFYSSLLSSRGAGL